MASSKPDYFENVPKHSKEIQVTSILNPYYIRVKDRQFNHEKKKSLILKLYKLVNDLYEHPLVQPYKPAVGDDVIVTDKIDLPDMICRGVVMDTTPNTSDVFFLDDGITLNVDTKSLIKYSRDSIPVEALTYTVGIHNILPASVSKDFEITKEWSKDTIDFVKDLIQHSSKIYFKSVTYDCQKCTYYGDLFLVLENENVNLRKVLLHSHLAVPLNDNLLQNINTNFTEDTIVPFKLEKKKSFIQKIVMQQSMNNLLLQDQDVNKLSKRQTKEKMLIKGKFSIKPLVRIEDSGFPIDVHQTIKNNGVHSLKAIQCYMWPAVKSGYNLVAIGHSNSGKTTGYVVPIISAIVESQDLILKRQKNETVTKPVALILCTSVIRCVDAATKFNKILYNHESIKTFAGHNEIDDMKTVTQLLNKFHILITTIPFLIKTLKNYSNKLNLSELSYLVLDGADVLLSNHLPEIMNLIKKYQIINFNNENNIQDGPMQIITVAQTWTDQIGSFIDINAKDSCIVIASYIEAAAYCKVQGKMMIRHSEKKKEEVLSSLNEYTKVKTIIFCLNSIEATELNDYLKSKSINTLLAHENLTRTQIQEIKDDWTKYLSGMYPVIICTDDILEELEITDVEFLIHYSVTNTSKTQFSRRFSVLMDNWQVEEDQYHCKVLILFDENKDITHFRGVVNILKRLNVKLPEDWSIIAEGLDLASNLSKKNYPLCDSIMLFGKCGKSSCPYRHRIIAEVDKPQAFKSASSTTDINISTGDELKLQITKVHNASHFSARIMQCIKVNKATGLKETHQFSSDLVKLSSKMIKYFSEKKNSRPSNDVNVGNIYVLKSYVGQYLRVQVLNVVETDAKTNKPKQVRLRNIDNGEIFEKSYVHDLLEIPKDLLEYKPQVVEIYLIGLIPPDAEYKWSGAADQESNTWYNENKDGFACTKVVLHLGNAVWSDSLVIRTKLIGGFSDLKSSPINNILRSKKYANENKSHESLLLNLCKSGGLIAEDSDLNAIKQEEKEE